ncbi:MAG: hypothetical protein P8188_01225 [Gemmatimonadota bacterium]
MCDAGDGVRREGDEADRRNGPAGGLPETPPCPFCDGTETELMNAFGSHASVATYWCRRCRSPFEMLKWRGGRSDPKPGLV